MAEQPTRGTAKTEANRALLAEIEQGPKLDEIYQRFLQQTGTDRKAARRLLAEWQQIKSSGNFNEYLVHLIEIVLKRRIAGFVDTVLGTELNLELFTLCVTEYDRRFPEKGLLRFANSALEYTRKVWILGIDQLKRECTSIFDFTTHDAYLMYFLLHFLVWLEDDGTAEDKQKIWDDFYKLAERETPRNDQRETGGLASYGKHGRDPKIHYDEHGKKWFFRHLKFVFLGVAP